MYFLRPTACFALALSVTASAAAQGPTPGAPPPPIGYEDAFEETPPPNNITINPLALAFGVVNLQYERAIGRRVSIFVGPSILAFSGIIFDFDIFGFGVDTGFRAFIIGHAPEGWWIGPQLAVAWAHAEDDLGNEAQGAGFGVAALTGYTWVFDGGFVFSLGAGGGWSHAQASSDGEVTAGFDGPTIAARLALGWGF